MGGYGSDAGLLKRALPPALGFDLRHVPVPVSVTPHYLPDAYLPQTAHAAAWDSFISSPLHLI